MKFIVSTGAALGLSLCLAGPAAAQADFSKFYQIGDSITAGYLDGCWVQHGQVNSFGAILARQAGASGFEQPIMGEPGLGNGVGPGLGCLILTSLTPTFSRAESVLRPLNLNLPRPYNNLAVPGYKVKDVTDSKSSADNANPLTDLVLRGSGATVLQQAASVKPTFVTIFIGNNDFLGAAAVGTALEGVTLTPLNIVLPKVVEILDTMKAAQGGTGKGVVMLLPDPTTLPFTSTISPVISGPDGKPLINPANGYPLTFISKRIQKLDGIPTGDIGNPAPIPPTSLITLNAAPLLAVGFGIPCSVLNAGGAPANDPRRANCDKPLPDDFDPSTGAPGVVLYPDEVLAIQNRIEVVNATLSTVGANDGFKVFDTGAFFKDLVKNGRSYGGISITTSYLSGGFFSLDGVHPTTIGYAIAADELIQFINSNFGTSIPRVDMPTYFGAAITGGAALVRPTSNEEFLSIVAEIFSPKNWNDFKTVLGAPRSTGLTLGDSEAPIRWSRSPDFHGPFEGREP
jgi:lysophospholipase L1-like esterase